MSFVKCMVLAAAVALAACTELSDLGYDAAADPDIALEQASAQARQQHKRILMVAGGSWCKWCHALSDFIHDDAEVSTALEQNFVLLKVYVGEENTNETFFARWPPAKGYPHFWVLSDQGTLLTSQDSDFFESQASAYDKQRFLGFIEQWRQP